MTHFRSMRMFFSILGLNLEECFICRTFPGRHFDLWTVAPPLWKPTKWQFPQPCHGNWKGDIFVGFVWNTGQESILDSFGNVALDVMRQHNNKIEESEEKFPVSFAGSSRWAKLLERMDQIIHPPKINAEPEKQPAWKGKSEPNLGFHVNFRGCRRGGSHRKKLRNGYEVVDPVGSPIKIDT